MLTNDQIMVLVKDPCKNANVNALYYVQQENGSFLFYADVPVNIGFAIGGLYEDLKKLFHNIQLATYFGNEEEYKYFLRKQVKVYDSETAVNNEISPVTKEVSKC